MYAQELFDKLYLEHSQRLYAIAKRLLGDADLAYDVVNDTFLILFLKIEIVKEHPNPAGWLVHTLKNRIGNELQLAYRAHDVELNEQLPAGEQTLEDSLFTFADSLPDGLKKDENEILTMFYEQDLSCDEISKRIGKTPLACRVRLCRAREHCRQLLENKK